VVGIDLFLHSFVNFLKGFELFTLTSINFVSLSFAFSSSSPLVELSKAKTTFISLPLKSS
jgi:hypothetical protein